MNDIEIEKLDLLVERQKIMVSGVVMCLTGNIMPKDCEINLMTYIRLSLARISINQGLDIVEKILSDNSLKTARICIKLVMDSTKTVKSDFFPGGFVTEDIENECDGETDEK